MEYELAPELSVGYVDRRARRVPAIARAIGCACRASAAAANADRVARCHGPGHDDLEDLGLAAGECSCLVEDDGIGLREALEILRPFHQDSLPGGECHAGERARGHGNANAGPEVGE